MTTALKQLEDSKLRRSDQNFDGGPIFTLSLAATGYDFLNKNDQKPDSITFQNRMRNNSDLLLDSPDDWDKEFTGQIDLLIIVADDNNATASDEASQIISQTAPFAVLLKNQRGNVLKTEVGVGIEHFGYADGVSQPMYLADEINDQEQPRIWDDKTNLDRLLVKEDKIDTNEFYGSYLVFRKLNQNVLAFKDAEGDNREALPSTKPDTALLPRVKDSSGNDNIELPGAMIVGRFENGTPVTMRSNEFQNDLPPTANLNPHRPTNDFDYSDDIGELALKCPYHAHIRLMNPRNGDPKADPSDLRTHRITRRGMPYDDNFDNENVRIPDEHILSITDDMLKKQKGINVGLLFMCYQNDIANAFEILQGFWAQGDIAPNADLKGIDSIISQASQDSRVLPEQWGVQGKVNPVKFDHFVTMKGGEYFFTPSKNFLMNL
ncbi:peroxidase [Mucilaginibacter rubeus]|nr:peroxidase [Mucilaginibacter rubeus]